MATCEVCSEAKLTALPFGKNSHRCDQPLDKIQADVCGPMRNESRGKAKYFLMFTDDYSRWTEIRFLRNKSEVLQSSKEFKALAEKQTGRTIKCLQSDNGKEFCNEEFDKFLKKEGITRKLTTPYTPQLNGVAERKNRTLMEMARCMMTQSKLPISFWAEAVATANFNRNRCITKALGDKTPFELWYGRRPDVKHMRTFGETAYMLNKAPGKGKLDLRGIKCIFVGYDKSSKSYRVWVPSKQKVTVTRDIKFVDVDAVTRSPKESTPSSADQDQDSICSHEKARSSSDFLELYTNRDLNEQSENDSCLDDSLTDEDAEERRPITETAKRGPGRPRRILTERRGRPRKLYQTPQENNLSEASKPEDDLTSNSEETDSPEANLVNIASEVTFHQALNGPDKDDWMNVIIEEVECLIKNDTWQIVNRPKNQNVIGCRMVLKSKYNSDRCVERKKARLVARGFT